MSLEQMLQHHLPDIQQFVGLISGAVLTVLYLVNSNATLTHKPLVAIMKV